MATILVVEDDRNIQQMLAEALRAEGFDVLCERDGSRAVDTFGRGGADAIILDVLLPGMNGFQVAEKVRALPRGATVPILMLSGIYRGARHQESAQNRFALAAYIEKPFRLDEIIGPLRAALAKPPVVPEQPAMRRDPVAGASEAVFHEPSTLLPSPAVASPAAASSAAPGSARSARIATRGTFAERSLPWVFGELMRRRATGVMLLGQGARAVLSIYFREGAPIGMHGRRRGAWLSTALLQARVVHEADIEESLRRARSSRRRFAGLVVDLELLTLESLRQIEQRRFEAALIDAFSWEHGEFRFYLRERSPAGLPRVEVAPLALLYRCTREGLGGVELAQQLASRLDERPVAAREFARVLLQQLSEPERTVLWNLDGSHTLRELIALRPVEEMGALLLVAMSTGLIVPQSAAARPLPTAQTAPSPPIPPARPEPPFVPPVPPRPAPPVTPAFTSRVVGTPSQPPPPPPQPRPQPPVTEPRNAPRPAQSPPAPNSPASLQPAVMRPPNAAAQRSVERLSDERPGPPRQSEERAPVTRVSAARSEPVAAPARDDDPVKLADLRARVEATEHADHWVTLGITKETTAAEVRASYHRLAKVSHPDRFALSGGELRELAEKLFARYAEAHRILGDPALRQQYEESSKRTPEEKNAATQLARVMGAEKAFREGELEMKRRGYDAAVARFEEAVRLYPDEGEYHAYLGYALSMAHPTDAASLRRATAELAGAKKLSPKCVRAFVFQGYVHKNAGRMDLAEREFREALEVDNRDVEAARELRLLALRREKERSEKKKR